MTKDSLGDRMKADYKRRTHFLLVVELGDVQVAELPEDADGGEFFTRLLRSIG